MSRIRKSDRIYCKRTKSSLVPIFAFLLVCGGVSFAVASVWHNVSGDAALIKAERAQEAQAETQEQIKIDSERDEEKESETKNEPEKAEKPEETAESSAKDEEETTPAEKIPEKEETSSPVGVDESERVTSEYFNDAAFVGDSITQGIQVYDIMADTTVIANKGLNPQSILNEPKIRTADGYVTALEALEKAGPKKIYIMLGVNGIGFELDTFSKLYKEFVAEVKEAHPDSTIYIQSMLPVTKAFEDGANNPYDITNEKINTYNDAIKKIAEDLDVHYLDVASAFKDEDGYLPNEASPTDGIHFGPTYYTKWFDYLKTHTA